MINAKCYIRWILCTQIFSHLIHISTSLWQKKVTWLKSLNKLSIYTSSSFEPVEIESDNVLDRLAKPPRLDCYCCYTWQAFLSHDIYAVYNSTFLTSAGRFWRLKLSQTKLTIAPRVGSMYFLQIPDIIRNNTLGLKLQPHISAP